MFVVLGIFRGRVGRDTGAVQCSIRLTSEICLNSLVGGYMVDENLDYQFGHDGRRIYIDGSGKDQVPEVSKNLVFRVEVYGNRTDVGTREYLVKNVGYQNEAEEKVFGFLKDEHPKLDRWTVGIYAYLVDFGDCDIAPL